MAEEIDIIALWDKGKLIDSTPHVDIDKAIKSQSKGTLYWIRIILKIEFWLNVAVILGTIYFVTFQEFSPIWGSVIIGISIIYLFYYQFLINQIKRFSFVDDVKTNLKKLYNYLRYFLLHYKVVIWLSMALGLIRSFVEDIPNQLTPEQINQPNFWPVLIITSSLFSIGIGAIIHYLVHLIYGKKIKRLKNLVKEFSS